jgi:hypothetical protein
MYAVVIYDGAEEAVVTFSIQVRTADTLISVHEKLDEALRARDGWNEGTERVRKNMAPNKARKASKPPDPYPTT